MNSTFRSSGRCCYLYRERAHTCISAVNINAVITIAMNEASLSTQALETQSECDHDAKESIIS